MSVSVNKNIYSSNGQLRGTRPKTVFCVPTEMTTDYVRVSLAHLGHLMNDKNEFLGVPIFLGAI